MHARAADEVTSLQLSPPRVPPLLTQPHPLLCIAPVALRWYLDRRPARVAAPARRLRKRLDAAKS